MRNKKNNTELHFKRNASGNLCYKQKEKKKKCKI